jgi:heterodisulfide reductase subunit A
LSLKKKHVTIIGAGIAGLAAADRLTEWGLHVSLLEKTPFPGGHAIQLSCKATDNCVKCGACLAEDKLLRVERNPKIQILTGTRMETLSGPPPFRLRYRSTSPLVNAEKCNGCGICLRICPVPGAILQGQAPRVGPYVAIRQDLCLYFEADNCALCRDACPQGAIQLSAEEPACELETDALLIATGFRPYNPATKPYGYGLFQNVLTSLDAERILRDHFFLKRPSDGLIAQRIAFIQCVGSRDATLGHPWCSKICCGSSLRMARLIQSRQAEAQITFFYIDVQTFGKNFQSFYKDTSEQVKMIRAIPGDIINTEKDELQVFYFDPEAHSSTEDLFDLVVLSIGLTPPEENLRLTQIIDWTLEKDGFVSSHDNANTHRQKGVFTTGTAMGPMTIAETIGSAEKTAFDMIQFLGGREWI